MLFKLFIESCRCLRYLFWKYWSTAQYWYYCGKKRERKACIPSFSLQTLTLLTFGLSLEWCRARQRMRTGGSSYRLINDSLWGSGLGFPQNHPDIGCKDVVSIQWDTVPAFAELVNSDDQAPNKRKKKQVEAEVDQSDQCVLKWW